MRKLVIAFLVILSSSMLGCTQPPGMKEFESISRTPNSTEHDRMEAFNKYPVDRQVDMYLYSQSHVQGGNREFFQFMKADGVAKLPVLIARLDSSESTDYYSTVGLIEMIDAIDNECNCLADFPTAYSVISRKEESVEESDLAGVKDFKRLYSKIRSRIEERRKISR